MARNRGGETAPTRGRRVVAPWDDPTFGPPDVHTAGIDVSSTGHHVAVCPGAAPAGDTVREFGCYTPDLFALADWLRQCGVQRVAMEATGVYWIPLYQILEERGFDVCLANPRNAKGVPGRKSDVLDCQWLCKIHSYRLLQASMRPPGEIVVLRAYWREQKARVADAAVAVQHMLKALTQMNLHLRAVLDDVAGVTGMAIIRAIVAGERDPARLAALRDRRCRHTEAEIRDALTGDYRPEHVFALRQALVRYDCCQSQIAECEAAVRAHLETLAAARPGPEPPAPPAPGPCSPPPRPPDLREVLVRLAGADVTQFPGVGADTGLTVISEVGTDMTKWEDEHRFSSWLGLAPGTRITGGKVLSSRSRKVVNRAATAFRMAASSLHRSNTALGAMYRHWRARLGPAKAITATAHRLAVLFYRLLRYGQAYVDIGATAYEARTHARQQHALEKRAAALGFTLVPLPPATGSS